jgi:hypothetical protein
MVVLVLVPLVAAGTEFEGTYTGTRVRTKGDQPTCPVENSVSARIQGASLTFNDSTLHDFVTGFDPNPDGTFGQTYVDAGGGTLQIRGHIKGGTLDADVMQGLCGHHWHLKRTP